MASCDNTSIAFKADILLQLEKIINSAKSNDITQVERTEVDARANVITARVEAMNAFSNRQHKKVNENWFRNSNFNNYVTQLEKEWGVVADFNNYVTQLEKEWDVVAEMKNESGRIRPALI